MSGQLPDGQPAEVEATLRRALLLAAASVEPSAGGLDKIRAKIAARRSSPLRWLPASLQGARSGLAGSAGLTGLAGWLTRSAVAALARAWDEVLVRFRPDPDHAGMIRWLRPASAVATVAFVLGAASWAIATLPHTARPVSGPRPRGVISAPPPGGTPAISPSNSSYSGGIGPPSTLTPSPSPTCPGPGPHVIKPSPSPSPSVTPSTSPSPSAGSPSDQPSPSAAASPVASMISRLADLQARHASLAKPSPTPSPGSSSTPTPRTGPCLRP
jgi:hypothetical protein